MTRSNQTSSEQIIFFKERKENEQNNLTSRSRARGYWQKNYIFSTYWHCVYVKCQSTPERDVTAPIGEYEKAEEEAKK